MASPSNLAVPKGSIVLVTAANGLLGSHIADQYLYYGYKVRGVVRDVGKNAWLANIFQAKYGNDSFKLFEVPDMAAEGAYDEAIKGVSIFVHAASVLTLEHDPNKVITPSIAGAVNAIKAAYGEPSVKRFVLTSSTTAAVTVATEAPGIRVTESTWNEAAIKEAWAPPPHASERAWCIYGASKAQAEQEVWKYHKEHQSERFDIVVNTVLPGTTYGKSVDPVYHRYSSTSILPVLLWKGEVTDIHHGVHGQYFIDTVDCGRLHVAAGILESVKDRRIMGCADKWSYDRILEILRKIDPNKTFPENFSAATDWNDIEGGDRSEQLLKDLGRPGWTSLEDSLRGLVEDLNKHGA